MKFSHVLIFATLMVAHPLMGAMEWHSDYQAALGISQKENKPLLLFFNGSDWSGQSMWMKREVLSQSSFESKIGNRFICVEADFPEHSTLSVQSTAQNQELKKRFHIYEMPTLLILDPSERVIAQVGYLPESGDLFAEELLNLVKQDEQLTQGLQNLPSNPQKLKKLYEIAQELGRQTALDQIVEAGLKTEDTFFFLEKYRLLVEHGAIKSEDALSLREKVAKLDPNNEQGVHFTLALIDFQELSQTHLTPDAAVQPLLSYLDQFGSSDPKNVWSIEMMIAQHYMDADIQDKALLHAEKALLFAPETMRPEITHSLNYIRSATPR